MGCLLATWIMRLLRVTSDAIPSVLSHVVSSGLPVYPSVHYFLGYFLELRVAPTILYP